MKNILAAFLILAASANACIPGLPDFMKLDKTTAAAAARMHAEMDFRMHRYRCLVFGKRAADSPFDQQLAKAGVRVKVIAGCVVSEGIIEGARVYNEIMREKLKARLGYDVFDENAQPQTESTK